jgi:hypothetical protein
MYYFSECERERFADISKLENKFTFKEELIMYIVPFIFMHSIDFFVWYTGGKVKITEIITDTQKCLNFDKQN